MHITGGKIAQTSSESFRAKHIRPTSSKVRNIFPMIGQDRPVSFLDSFGGSGIMGMEAWSRGAPVLITEKTFVPSNTGTDRNIRCAHFFAVLRRTQRYERRLGCCFLDPPYHFDIHHIQKIEIASWIVIAETAVNSPPDPHS